MVSVLRMLLVVSTKRGIELFIIGINLGMTRFLLPIAIAVWNSISFCVWSFLSSLNLQWRIRRFLICQLSIKKKISK